jgi:chemotaxis protein histidine kinase CheA
MLPDARARLERELRALSEEFAAGLPQRLSDIQMAWQAAVTAQWSASAFDALYRHCHSLAGAGGTFGFDDVGMTARALSDWLKEVREYPALRDEEVGARLVAGIERSVRAVCAPGGG